jgi:hypothetical protein
MRKLMMAAVMVMGVAAVTMAAQEQKFGGALTLNTVTKVSDIYANPETFSGKRVLVQGPIVDVCEQMGCWLALGSDKDSRRSASGRRRRHGVPDATKGMHLVEGIPQRGGSRAQQIAQVKKCRKEDHLRPKTVKGLKTSILTAGEGAVVY